MYKNLLFRIILMPMGALLTCLSGYSQPAPGGVNAGMTLWLKADAVSTVTGNPVSSWSTSGGSATGYTVSQATAVNMPSLIGGATNYVNFNYNPRIKFGPTLTTLRNTATTPNLLGNNGTAIVVTDQNLDGNALTYYSVTTYKYQFKPFFRFQTGALGTGYVYNWTAPTEYSSFSASMFAGYGCGNNMWLRKNSIQDNTPDLTATTYNPAIVAGLCLGANGVVEPGKMSIAEVILFNNKPSLADMDKIESYLAIKYGITRGGNTGTTSLYNYVSASNVVLWDKTLNTGYNNDIAGIGREDASGLAQKQSISINNGEALTIALGNAAIPTENSTNTNNFSADVSFLVWGNNGSAKTFNTAATKPSGITERLDRIWKTQATNFAQPTSFGFETSQITGLGSTTDLCLLFDDDGDFTNATIAGACSATNPTGTRIEFTGISIPAGLPYISLARVGLTTFTASNNGPVCAGSNINLSVTAFPNTTYSWTGPNGFTSSSATPVITAATIAASSPPDYVVTSTILGGCVSTASTSVIVNPSTIPTITILSDQGNTICTDSLASFTASVTNEGTAPIYQWNVNGTNVGSNSSTYSGNTFGNGDIITCSITSNASCASPATVSSNPINLVVLPALQVDAGTPVTISSGSQVTIDATSNATNYLWTPATGLSSTSVLNPVANPISTTVYSLTVSNALGCFTSDEVTITVNNKCINVRNAFSPNGDGINDLWLVYDAFDCFKKVSVHVYNRYGSAVYESKDYRNNWDGRYKGKTLPDGTYYAVIEFKLTNGRSFTINSDLTILR